jgi:hypothetical protein
MTIKITLLALAIAGLGFSSCKQSPQAVTAPHPDAQIVDTLTYETALRYVKNYESRAGTVDSGLLGANGLGKIYHKPNTRCVWFSVGRLDSLVKKIKNEGGDGIRFYLASYDKNYDKDFVGGHKPDKQFWGFNTLVMVSTTRLLGDTNKYHWDYYKGKPAQGQTKTDGGFIVGAPPENRGEQCPPPATCSSIGATLIQ